MRSSLPPLFCIPAHRGRFSTANIDEVSGSVCLDVINQTWSPMFDMINIFEVFLPQLLRYPNAADPLNGEAAALLMRDPKAYDLKVKGAFLFLSFRFLSARGAYRPMVSRELRLRNTVRDTGSARGGWRGRE